MSEIAWFQQLPNATRNYRGEYRVCPFLRPYSSDRPMWWIIGSRLFRRDRRCSSRHCALDRERSL